MNREVITNHIIAVLKAAGLSVSYADLLIKQTNQLPSLNVLDLNDDVSHGFDMQGLEHELEISINVFASPNDINNVANRALKAIFAKQPKVQNLSIKSLNKEIDFSVNEPVAKLEISLLVSYSTPIWEL